MSTQTLPRMTFEQYLAVEREAEYKSEFIHGGVYAMAGASPNHGWIQSNVLFRLQAQLQDGSCGARGSDTRIYIPQFDVGTYPDVVVTCGPDRYLDSRKDNIVDATLIVEVLSPSTQNFDRSEKFEYYRSLPSFAEYLLVSQNRMRAEHHARQPDGSWLFREYVDPETRIELKSIGCHLVLKDLYARVEFEAAGVK